MLAVNHSSSTPEGNPVSLLTPPHPKTFENWSLVPSVCPTKHIYLFRLFLLTVSVGIPLAINFLAANPLALIHAERVAVLEGGVQGTCSDFAKRSLDLNDSGHLKLYAFLA